MLQYTKMLKLLIVGGLLLIGAQAYHSGAAPSACDDSKMFPSGHAPNVASGPSPYGITLSDTTYTAGGSITVTLEGGGSMGGFLILALPADDATGSPIGSFEAQDNSQNSLVQAACTNGLTHTADFHGESPQLNKIILTWNAPSALAGNIIFYVTFVRVQTEFWVKVPSEPVWDGVSPKPTTTTTSAPSAITDPTPLSPGVTNSGCGSSKGCYSDCEGSDCGFLLTWKKSGDNVDFEMFGKLESNQGYIALGLGKAAEMTDVSIIACTADDTRTSKVEQYYASSRVPPTYQATGPISGSNNEAAVQEANGPKTMSCRFTYDNSIAKNSLDQWKDLDSEIYLFVARGAYPTGEVLAKHGQIPKISPNTIKLTDTNYEDIGGTRINGLIKAHACIMVLAWVFCASVGLILARYYKPMWADTKACGQKVWFSYHRALMLSAMFLTIIGFILILIYQKGKFVTPKDLPQKAHPILGLIAIICALLNPLIAAFRCGPEDSKRPIFNWAHWFIGTVAHVFAIVAIFLGMLLSNAAVPGWITYVMMVFCIFHVCVEFILEIHQCCMYDKNRDRQEEYSLANADGKGGPPQYAGRGFKCGMLVLYMIVVTAITIALVVIIALGGSTIEVTS